MNEAPNPFVGSWNVAEATLPDGQVAYTGTIEIQQNGSVFDLEWDISAGRYVGIGLPVKNHLLVSCGEQRAGLGLALFQIQPAGAVSVSWSTPELQGAVGHGRFLAPVGDTFEGNHAVTQFLPDGALFGEWTVAIQKAGTLYEVAWRKSEAVHFTGLGFETPAGLAVGWYPDLRQLAFLDYMADDRDHNRLTASWALGGFTARGTEALERLPT
jgi:hypothetical protein